ncbi:MAG TPA: inositol 2-dehydrogenase [Terracidiphilus sp.]|jgi:myo-inositol 2-dehydrogenase/D-chiro-inositol 1-dehydrogenase|nr:inositol 2-dehydrogenase [Terracidiphilus sp.]
MSTKKLHFGLIGAGRIGRVHAETVAFRLPEAEIVAITDVNREAAQALAARCGIPSVVPSATEIFADPRIDAVLICTSTDTHAGLIVDAAKAGKHIFCEKPISLSLDKIDSSLAAVQAAGVKLQVGFNRRFDSNFLRVRQSVVSGEIGTPSLLHIISRDPAPPPLSYLRPSGGIFLDMMIHDFDMARYLIGEEVDEVYASAGVLVEPGFRNEDDFDTAVVVLHFRSGAIGTIDNSRKAVFGYDQRVEILGSKGKIATENRYPNQVVVSGEKCVYTDLPLNFFMQRYTESFALELELFTQAVLEDKPIPVTGDDSRVPVVMALAARKSLDERRPVRLSEVSQ